MLRGTVIITSLLVSVLVLSGFGLSDAYAMTKADLIATIAEKTSSGDSSRANNAQCEVTSTEDSIVYGSDDTNRFGIIHIKLQSPDGGDLPDEVVLTCVKGDANGSQTLDVKRIMKAKLTIQPENNSDSFFDVFFDVYTIDSFFDIFTELQNSAASVDSFFDVFFDVDADGNRNTPDSFFDIFTDLGEDRTTTPDSFFDVFVEIDSRDRHFDTEILAMDLRGHSCNNVGDVVTGFSTASDGTIQVECVPDQTGTGQGSSLTCENQIALAAAIPEFTLEEQCDADGDNVGDLVDNCPTDSNSNQSDVDGDGLGDVCDLDDDGDGVDDTADNCPADSNSNQSDVDGDRLGDVCDPNPNHPQNNDCSNFNPGADLSLCDLSNTRFQGKNLDGANFRGADLPRTQFLSSSVRNADFTDADMTNAFFANMPIFNADFVNVNLSGARFQNVGTTSVDFTGAYADPPCTGIPICSTLPTTP